MWRLCRHKEIIIKSVNVSSTGKFLKREILADKICWQGDWHIWTVLAFNFGSFIWSTNQRIIHEEVPGSYQISPSLHSKGIFYWLILVSSGYRHAVCVCGLENHMRWISQVKTESTLNTLKTVATLKQILEKDHAHTARLSWTFKKMNSIDMAGTAGCRNTRVTKIVFFSPCTVSTPKEMQWLCFKDG